jgi:hypothetical protein
MGDMTRGQAYGAIGAAVIATVAGVVTLDLKGILVGIVVIPVALLSIRLSRRTDRKVDALNRDAFGD